MTKRRMLSNKVIEEALGTSGLADYVHNGLLAVSKVPKQRVIRALSGLDFVVDLAKLCAANDSKEEWLLQDWWKKRARRPRDIASATGSFAHNLDALSTLLGLTPLETSTLRLAADIAADPMLDELYGALHTLGFSRQRGAIAALLGKRREEINEALRVGGRLERFGLIEPSHDRNNSLEVALHVSAVLDDAREHTAASLRECLLPATRGSTLSLDDYGHVSDAALALEVARRALQHGRPGVNVLLYGAPGTGKSEFARVMAAACGATLQSIEVREGNDVASARIARLRTVLQVAPRPGTLILFDELEDLFTRSGFFVESMTPRMSKQAFNELLETNPVPVVWTTNRVAGMDPAFLRRFTCAVAFRPLGVKQRARVLGRKLNGRLTEADVKAVALRYSASPAQLSAAVETSGMLGDGAVTRASLEQVLAPVERLLTGRDPSTRAVFDAATFREGVLNASTPVSELVSVARRWQPGMNALAMCFSGPPGTGKTELAQYLASVMERPVMRKTSADILDMYVGGTEQKIAEAFEEAQQDGAVLVFDEVDSLLRDRRGAQHSWEATQVNELLQRLETYRGVVICTTNLVEDLDQAAMRRFPFKVRFDWVRPEQAVELFLSVLGGFVPGASAVQVSAALQGLTRLAPGDFAAVSRRVQWLSREWTVESLAQELREELTSRRDRARVGFSA